MRRVSISILTKDNFPDDKSSRLRKSPSLEKTPGMKVLKQTQIFAAQAAAIEKSKNRSKMITPQIQSTYVKNALNKEKSKKMI
jgi:hypothetical protein